MRPIIVATMLGVLLGVGVPTAGAAPSGWAFVGTNTVASSPVRGGGYPVPAGSTAPLAGTCREGWYDANRSESALAVKPGSEDLVGSSKFFFETFSTFYMFHLGSYTIEGGVPVSNNQVQGYDCVSTGTQAMPPSWTNNTDPNVDFDTQGRAHQVTLPFNAYWTNLHPNGAIMLSYSDDLGRHWTVGNGGRALEELPNQSSLAFGHVEDKQWVAVNRCSACPYRDHVYAAWAVFNGSAIKVRMAVSRDRGATFDRAVTLSRPNEVGAATTYVYPTVDVAGNVYVSLVSFPPNGGPSVIYVSRSIDDARTWGPFVPVTAVGTLPTCCLPNTTFRDGIVESFAASQTYPDHVFLTYEEWDGSQFDVKLRYSLDGGTTWSPAALVDDASNSSSTDQFQPTVATGPNGAVAVAFYDRREACGTTRGYFTAPGAANHCINTSLQAYKETATSVAAVGSNLRISEQTWDPEQPAQTIGGIDQMACAAHSNPCRSNAFIGDYFGLAISAGNIYGLFVSTAYPSGRTGINPDGSTGPVYYQQQVLASVPRSTIATGY
jgi:hypothetical protein